MANTKQKINDLEKELDRLKKLDGIESGANYQALIDLGYSEHLPYGPNAWIKSCGLYEDQVYIEENGTWYFCRINIDSEETPDEREYDTFDDMIKDVSVMAQPKAVKYTLEVSFTCLDAQDPVEILSSMLCYNNRALRNNTVEQYLTKTEL